MSKNGELLPLEHLKSCTETGNGVTIFDIGANRGDYARLASTVLPNSIVHCFEIIPDTRLTLRKMLSGMSNVIISDYGLSNKSGSLDVVCESENDERAHVKSRYDTEGGYLSSVRVTTGDSYVGERGIERIDLLKIDTEGHDMMVLEGFRDSLNKGVIRIVQFEYGYTWIRSRKLLKDAYELLESSKYKVGRLYPDGVMFKKYNWVKDEHYRMGNYVAVHERSEDIFNLLKLRNL
ncbi:MAG: FkbM family methyltransferase [Pseudomonadota bacterium]|nr:MAG: FkbM family methyltransferase [Pseudomonadota bacterium]